MSDVFEIRGCCKLFANIQHDSYTNTGTFFLPEPIIGASINVVSFFRMLNIKFSSLRLVYTFLSMSPNEQLHKISDKIINMSGLPLAAEAALWWIHYPTPSKVQLQAQWQDMGHPQDLQRKTLLQRGQIQTVSFVIYPSSVTRSGMKHKIMY